MNNDEKMGDDMDTLSKILDNFASSTDEDNQEIDDGSSLDIEQLIQEGNKYSEEIQRQLDEENQEMLDAQYDENGRYIANDNISSIVNGFDDELNKYIDNANEDDLLSLLESMSSDIEDTSNQEIQEAPSMPTLEVDPSKANDMMSADDIAALFAQMEGDSPSDGGSEEGLNVNVEQLDSSNQEDLDSNDLEGIASMDNEAPTLEVDPSKANDMMSDDDIAALFAQMEGDVAGNTSEAATLDNSIDNVGELSSDELEALMAENNADDINDNIIDDSSFDGDEIDDLLAQMEELEQQSPEIMEDYSGTKDEENAIEDISPINDDSSSTVNDEENETEIEEDNKKKRKKKKDKKAKKSKKSKGKDTDQIENDTSISDDSNQELLTPDNVIADDEFSTSDGTVFMPKQKKSLLTKLFANVPDKNPPKEESNEDDFDVRDELGKDGEEAKVDKKAEKERIKKEKAEEKKALKERKAEEKKAKKEKKAKEASIPDVEDNSHINKIGATIIFILAAALCVAIIMLQTKFSYSNKIKRCEKYMDVEKYDLAYLEINGMKLKTDSDKELYHKLRTIMYVQQYVNDSNNFFEINLYDKSANSLIMALQKYQLKLADAKEYEVEDIYEKLHTQILEELKEEFDINEDQANYLLGIESNDVYSESLRELVEKKYPPKDDE